MVLHKVHMPFPLFDCDCDFFLILVDIDCLLGSLYGIAVWYLLLKILVFSIDLPLER